MFTGIVQHVGCVLGLRPSAAGKRLEIDVGPLAQSLDVGASVCVSGACLTAAAIAGGVAQFDVVPETLSRTKLGRLGAGSRVNLERALTAGQGLDGHLVQGHVDGLAQVKAVRRAGSEWKVDFAAGEELTEPMAPKGSVAIDGVSLTLVDVSAGGFSVALIPTTLEQTTLGGLAPGDSVNIETDIIGKYVMRYLQRMRPAEGLTMEKLRDAGFV